MVLWVELVGEEVISLIEKLEFEMKKLNDMKARYRWGKRKKFIIQRARNCFHN